MFGFLVVPASAELHRVTVTLVNGQTLTLTVDVPRALPSTRSRSPACRRRSQSIVDLGPVETPTPTPTPTATPTPRRRPSDARRRRPPHARAPPSRPARPRRPPRAREQGRRTERRQAASRPLADRSEHARPEHRGARPASSRSRPRTSRATTSTSPNPTRNTDGSPTLDNPTVSLAEPGARAASASRTSSSRSSASRRSCSRSTRPPASSTACAGRSWPRSTRSRPTTAATSTSPRPARSAGCSSCPRPGSMYGVDGNRDGLKDPYNPVDAIFAAARYLKAAGAEQDLRARDLRLQPRRLVRRLGHPPRALHRRAARRPRRLALRADAGPLPRPGQGVYAATSAAPRSKDGTRPTWSSRATRRNGIKIFAKRGAPVVAVNDGRIVRTGHSRRLGNFVTLQDVYGNTYTYGHLEVGRGALPDAEAAGGRRQGRSGASCSCRRATPRRQARHRETTEAEAPRAPGAARTPRRATRRSAARRGRRRAPRKERLFANPDRPNARPPAATQQA